MVNSISWNPSIGNEFVFNLTVNNISYSCIKDGWEGEGNIDEDPQFESFGNYNLTAESPCNSAGKTINTPLIDIIGNSRPAPFGSSPDMGAYENDYLVTALSFNKPSSNVSAYPNPFVSATNILLENTATYTIHTITGGLVETGALLNGENLIGSDLRKGSYILEIKSNKETSHQTIIKQ